MKTWVDTRVAIVALILLVAIPRESLAPARQSSVDPPMLANADTARSAAPMPFDAKDAASIYGWPLAHPPTLTSSFGEYRPGHFHAGIDISTAGVEGHRVLAVADGDVVRVRASGVGYGRAVYLRLGDGRLAVYAHLQSMMEPLDRYVAGVQDSLGRYRVDLYPEPGTFRVRRGQEIGRSGSSGAGGPHLHFELREGDVAVNPLTHGLAAGDKRAPVLRALVFTPLSGDARIDGETNKRRVPLAATPPGEYAAAHEVRLWGRVGIGLDGFDRASDAGDRLGLYRLELYVDDALHFTTRFDRFDYNRNHEVEAEFDYEEVLDGRRSVHNLFVYPGVAGDFHGDLPAGAGILNAGADRGLRALAPGNHRLTVIVLDAAGNRTTARASVRVAGPPILERFGFNSAPGEPRRVELEARGRGASLARVELERGSRDGGKFAPWRGTPLVEGRYELLIGDDLPGNPHDVLRAQAVDSAGEHSNRLVLVAPSVRPDRLSGSSISDSGPGFAGPAIEDPPVVQLAPHARTATLELTFASSSMAPPEVSLPEGPSVVLDALDSRRFVAHIDARGQTPLHVVARTADGGRIDSHIKLPWTPVARSASGSTILLDGRLRVDYPTGAFFDDAYIWAAAADSARAARPGLLTVSPIVRVEPSRIPLDGGLWVGLHFDTTAVGPGPRAEGQGAVGLYRFDEGDAFQYQGAEWRGDGFLGAKMQRLGHVVLARDILPPVVQWLSPGEGKILENRRPRLRARVRDQGSGFREDEITFTIDGRRVPTEWDAEADRMIHRPRSPLAPGKHVLTAQATDRAGLTTRRTITVSVR